MAVELLTKGANEVGGECRWAISKLTMSVSKPSYCLAAQAPIAAARQSPTNATIEFKAARIVLPNRVTAQKLSTRMNKAAATGERNKPIDWFRRLPKPASVPVTRIDKIPPRAGSATPSTSHTPTEAAS